MRACLLDFFAAIRRLDKAVERILEDAHWSNMALAVFALCAASILANNIWFLFFDVTTITYDELWYQLPAALHYVGKLTYEYAPTSPYLLKALSDAPLLHIVQGILIVLSGTIKAAAWPGAIIMTLFVLTAWKVYGKAMNIMATIIFIASVPLLVLHMQVASTDLWVNALFAFSILAAERLWHAPAPRWAALSCLAVLGAIYSKMTLWPLCAFIGLLSAFIIALQCRRGLLPWKVLVIYAFVGGTLAPLWPLHLWTTYGNIFFPYPNPLAPSAPSLPLNPSETLSKSRACWRELNLAPSLLHVSNPRLFFLSFFELTRVMTDVPMNWDIGQFQPGTLHQRMGGFDGVTMAIGTFLIALGARYDLRLRFSAFLLLALTLITSVIMESHELRYFLFIPITMSVLIGRSCSLNNKSLAWAKSIMLPVAFLSPLFLAGNMLPLPGLADNTPALYPKYWKALDAYIKEHGVPNRPFCRPYIGPPITSDACELAHNKLFTRALAAGPNLSTYRVADWCVSDEPKLAPPPPTR